MKVYNMLHIILFILGVLAYSTILVSSIIVWAGIIAMLPLLTSFLSGFYYSVQSYIPSRLPLVELFTHTFFGDDNFIFKDMIRYWKVLKPAGLYAALFGHSFFITSIILFLILVNTALALEFVSICLFGTKGLWCFFYPIDSNAVFPMDLPADHSASVKPSDPNTNFISDKEKVVECNPPSPKTPEVPVLRKLDALDYTFGALILVSGAFLAIAILNAVFTK